MELGTKKSLDPQVLPDATRTCCLRWSPQSGWLAEKRKEVASDRSLAFALFFQNLKANLNNHRKGDPNILGDKSQLVSFHKIFKVHSYSTPKGNTKE